ncbi:hypothetical protein Lal_00033605 [Lupinus albus]|nr:hypothetical protein Lal_00033605 [Lupinus albus]
MKLIKLHVLGPNIPTWLWPTASHIGSGLRFSTVYDVTQEMQFVYIIDDSNLTLSVWGGDRREDYHGVRSDNGRVSNVWCGNGVEVEEISGSDNGHEFRNVDEYGEVDVVVIVVITMAM